MDHTELIGSSQKCKSRFYKPFDIFENFTRPAISTWGLGYLFFHLKRLFGWRPIIFFVISYVKIEMDFATFSMSDFTKSLL